MSSPSQVAKVDSTETCVERWALIGAFSGLAFWAWQCPCSVIFKCHRPEVLTFIGALFIWIFFRTGENKKNT